MNPTSQTKELQSLLKKRDSLTAEIGRVEKIGTQAAQDTASMLKNAATFDDPTAATKLTEQDARSRLAPARCEALRAELPELDKEIGDKCTEIGQTFCAGLSAVEESRYRKFVAALAPFFNDGERFFHRNPHTGDPRIPARLVFQQTDAWKDLQPLKRELGRCDPQTNRKPLARASILLNLLPRLPVE